MTTDDRLDAILLATTLRQRLAAAMDVPVEALRRGTVVLDGTLDDPRARAAARAICLELGRDPEAVLGPARRRRRGLEAAGLRRLAPFLPAARRRLALGRERVERWTLDSFERSLAAGRRQGSGVHAALPLDEVAPARTIAGLLAWSLLLALPMAVAAWALCQPGCQACGPLGATLLVQDLPRALVLVLGAHGLLALPALRAIWSARPPGRAGASLPATAPI